MKLEELKQALDKEGVNPVFYSLYGIKGDHEDNYDVLEKQGSKWMYYHYERRGKSSLQYFDTEDKACRYMLQILTKYPDTKNYGPAQAAKNAILLRVLGSKDGTEVQAFLDTEVVTGKMTSEQAATHMTLWKQVNSRKT